MKILRFTALWCADCIVMKPRWQKYFVSQPDFEIVDLDFDDDTEMTKKYAVKKVPELIILDKNENEIARMTGMQDQEALNNFFSKFIK